MRTMPNFRQQYAQARPPARAREAAVFPAKRVNATAGEFPEEYAQARARAWRLTNAR